MAEINKESWLRLNSLNMGKQAGNTKVRLALICISLGRNSGRQCWGPRKAPFSRSGGQQGIRCHWFLWSPECFHQMENGGEQKQVGWLDQIWVYTIAQLIKGSRDGITARLIGREPLTSAVIASLHKFSPNLHPLFSYRKSKADFERPESPMIVLSFINTGRKKCFLLPYLVNSTLFSPSSFCRPISEFSECFLYIIA